MTLKIPVIEPTFSGWVLNEKHQLKKVTADRDSNASAQEVLVDYIKSRNLFGHNCYVIQEQMVLTPITTVRVTTGVEVELCSSNQEL